MELKARRAAIKAALALLAGAIAGHSGLDAGEIGKDLATLLAAFGSDVGATYFDAMLPTSMSLAMSRLSLAEKVLGVESHSDWTPILLGARRSFDIVNTFDRILTACKPALRQSILQALLRSIEEGWGGSRHPIDLGSAILTRFASDLESSRTLFRLADRLEETVPDIDFRMVHTAESLSYVVMTLGYEGAFVGNFTRFIKDDRYRALDNAEGRVYYGSFEKSVDALIRHLKYRPGRVAIHDIGRAISLVPFMATRRDYKQQIPFVTAKMLESLQGFDPDEETMTVARNLLEKKASPT